MIFCFSLIGALYGRLVGLAMVKMFGVLRDHPLWAWIDPGAMALIGAASFFGGVSRLTMSLTVIMVLCLLTHPALNSIFMVDFQ